MHFFHTGCFFRKVPPRKVLSMELVPLNRIKWLSTLVPLKATRWAKNNQNQRIFTLRFCWSSRLTFCQNFLRSLFRDLLEAGGGALPSPHVGAGHLIDQNETRQFRNKHLHTENKEKGLGAYLWAYSAVIFARSAPCNFLSTRNVSCITVHTLTTVSYTHLTLPTKRIV